MSSSNQSFATLLHRHSISVKQALLRFVQYLQILLLALLSVAGIVLFLGGFGPLVSRLAPVAGPVVGAQVLFAWVLLTPLVYISSTTVGGGA
jgi:hypothetical protein